MVRIFGRIGFVFILAGLLAGCAGRPHGVLTEYKSSVPIKPTVKLFVVTNRSGDAVPSGEIFGGKRGRGLRFADIHISIPARGARKVGEVQWPSRLPGNLQTDFVTLGVHKLNQKQALGRFHNRLRQTRHRQVLVFVHGYNTRFEEAVYRFAQIVHDSKTPALPVLFTWPSRGKLLAYTYDRESANYSRDALEDVLDYLVKDRAVSGISILAHSMGNWVTLEALRQMAIRNKRIAPKIKNVMLAAPDVDADVFRRQIAEMGEKRPRFTLFVARDDKALVISRRVWGDEARVGSVNPKEKRFAALFKKARVDVVDLTGKSGGGQTKHNRFASNSAVVEMIGKRLLQGQTLSDSQPGIGERVGLVATDAAKTVGSAAGLAVSVPLAVVDGRTRDSLGSQANQVGGYANHTIGSVGTVVQGQ